MLFPAVWTLDASWSQKLISNKLLVAESEKLVGLDQSPISWWVPLCILV